MENFKLGYIHVPIHSYLPSRKTTNTVQETREPVELTEEEKNFIIIFLVISAILIVLFYIWASKGIKKLM
jgi:hypothetical protein